MLTLSRAAMNDSEICVGWMPFSRSAWHAFNRAPAITHTEVVPSPASMSAEVRAHRREGQANNTNQRIRDFPEKK